MLSSYPGRWLPLTCFALAVMSAGVVVFWLTIAQGILSCDFGTASSIFGTAERSWFPPGTTCTWTVNGTEHVDRPDPSRMLVVLMAVAGAPLGLYLRKVLRAVAGDGEVG